MDAIAGLLDGPRARGAFLLKLAFDPPWSVRIQDEAPIAVISVVRGSTLILSDGEAPVRLQAGDVAIARGPAAVHDRRRPRDADPGDRAPRPGLHHAGRGRSSSS